MSVEKVKKDNSDQMRNNFHKLKEALVLDQMRNDVHKLKEAFVDTIKFAIDRDLVKSLYTLLRLEKIDKKVGIHRIDVNEIMKTENVEIIKKNQVNCLTGLLC